MPNTPASQGPRRVSHRISKHFERYIASAIRQKFTECKKGHEWKKDIWDSLLSELELEKVGVCYLDFLSLFNYGIAMVVAKAYALDHPGNRRMEILQNRVREDRENAEEILKKLEYLDFVKGIRAFKHLYPDGFHVFTEQERAFVDHMLDTMREQF
jgi:hypothetical protein